MSSRRQRRGRSAPCAGRLRTRTSGDGSRRSRRFELSEGGMHGCRLSPPPSALSPWRRRRGTYRSTAGLVAPCLPTNAGEVAGDHSFPPPRHPAGRRFDPFPTDRRSTYHQPGARAREDRPGSALAARCRSAAWNHPPRAGRAATGLPLPRSAPRTRDLGPQRACTRRLSASGVPSPAEGSRFEIRRPSVATLGPQPPLSSRW